MKKTMYLIVMALSAMLIVAACGSSSNDYSAPIEDVDNSLPGSDSVNDNTAGGTQLAGSVITVADLEARLNIGASQEDVTILFDSHPYQEVTASSDAGNVWRYDFGAQADYTFESEVDMHDQQGILNGDVPLQVFIYFDEKGNVSHYTAYQAGSDGKITVYKTLNDGSREVENI
jgi:hypothetical protein